MTEQKPHKYFGSVADEGARRILCPDGIEDVVVGPAQLIFGALGEAATEPVGATVNRLYGVFQDSYQDGLKKREVSALSSFGPVGANYGKLASSLEATGSTALNLVSTLFIQTCGLPIRGMVKTVDFVEEVKRERFFKKNLAYQK